MSKIVSLFAPPVGAEEPVSGSSGKKAIKPDSLTKEDSSTLEGAVSGKTLRKKKNSFMDHLLFHGENLSPPLPPATLSAISGAVKKGTVGKTDHPSVLSPVPVGGSPKSSPPSAPVPSFVLSAGDRPGESPKSGEPTLGESPGETRLSPDTPSKALLSSPVSEGLFGKKEGPKVAVPGTGNKLNAESGKVVAVQSAPSEILSRTSVAGESPVSGKAATETDPKAFPGRQIRPSLKPLSHQKAYVDRGGHKTTGDAHFVKDSLRAGDPLTSQAPDKEESVPGNPFHEKEVARESPIFSERKTVSASSGDASSPDGGAGEKGASRDFSPDIPRSSEAKASQSAESSGSASNVLPPTVPDALGAAVSDRPSIDQREMVSKVISSARHGGGEISLRVHPPALGPIRIQVHVDPRTREVEVRLFAKDESIGDLLRSKSQDLKGALSREGFTMHRFHVDGGSGDLPASSSLPMASSGFSSGGDSSSGSSQGFAQGSGAFWASGQGGASPGFAQGGDGNSREHSSQALHTASGTPGAEEPFPQPPGKIANGDPSGFHRVV